MTTTTQTTTRFHLSLNVSNLGRSVTFYRDLLGFEPSKLREDLETRGEDSANCCD